MKKKTIPTQFLSAEFLAESVNEEHRSATVRFSSGAEISRFSWDGTEYLMRFSMDPGHVRLDRLNNGAPFLNTHNSYSLDSVLGVVEQAWLERGSAFAKVRFSQRPDVETIWNDVKTKIIRNVSMGVVVRKLKDVSPENSSTKTYLATDWEPFELSAVPVGADPGANFLSKGKSQICEVDIEEKGESLTMIKTEREGLTTLIRLSVQEANLPHEFGEELISREVDAGEAAKLISEKLSHRSDQDEIRRIVKLNKLPDSFAEKLIAEGTTLGAARDAVLDKLAEISEKFEIRSANPSAHLGRFAGVGQVIRDETDTRRELMAEALIHRANPGQKISEGARQYVGFQNLDFARECLELAGARTRGLTRREIAVASLNLTRLSGSMATSDFPEVLASTVGRSLRQKYELAPRTFVPFCRRSTAPNFKEQARVQLSELSVFQRVNEAGEYKYLHFSDSAEKYSLVKYGGIVAFTWESVINDDLSAFDRIPTMMAEEAAANESDIVYAILTGNPNMSDGNPIFDSAHSNYTSSGTAISDTSLGVGRAMMRKQTGPQGRILNLFPQYLIVGPDNEVLANKYTSASFVAAKSSDINPNFNTSLEVITEGRLTGNQWFLSASPGRIDTIEFAYLEGEEGIFTEQRVGFDVDGLEIKARHVFAAKAIDYRGLYKNAGN